jgi:microcompartment protein CcmK/EutM
MRVAEVIGKVTLSKYHPSVAGATWVVAVPLDRNGLSDRTKGRGEPFVVFDEWGANQESLIAVSEGAEAAAPFHPNPKPLDAYNSAIIDTIDVE